MEEKSKEKTPTPTDTVPGLGFKDKGEKVKYVVQLVVVVAVVLVGTRGTGGTIREDVHHDPARDEWAGFKTEHNKSYERVTDLYRMKIYLENKRAVDRHNRLYEEGTASFQLALNKYGDLLTLEFIRLMNGFRRHNHSSVVGATYVPPAHSDPPGHVDWRTKGAVTSVKDQEACGSCWAFSATGSLEGQHFRKTGNLVSLSEQNLIDCSSDYGNYGCSGGWMNSAFQYIMSQGGIDTEESYPYEGVEGQCRYNPESSGARIVGFVDLRRADEELLKRAVAHVGPISVAIDASLSFQFYSSGVYYDQECSSKNLDHGVLVVGYGSEDRGDYWLVKNSWGEEWGEQGYIKIARNRNNHCGVASAASYPLV